MVNPKTTARWIEVLRKQGVIDDLQLRSVNASMANFGWSLPRAVAELGTHEEEALVEAIARALKVPSLPLGGVLKDNGALRALGVDFCEKAVAFPVSLKDKVLTLAMVDPTDLAVIDGAKSLARGARVSVVMAAETQIRTAIAKHFRGQDAPIARRRSQSGSKPDPRLAAKLSDVEAARSATRAPPAAGTTPALPRFSAEERQRLEAAHLNQEKVSHILRTVQDLLGEKGFK